MLGRSALSCRSSCVAAEAASEGIAIGGGTDAPIGARTGRLVEAPPGCGTAKCRGWAWLRRSRLLPRSASARNVPVGEIARLLGGKVPRRTTKRASQQEQPLAQGNRHLRRLLNRAAHSPVKTKVALRGCVPTTAAWLEIHGGHLGHRPPHCRIVWKILHDGVRYKELGPAGRAKAKRVRTAKMIRQLRQLGYRVEPLADFLGALPA